MDGQYLFFHRVRVCLPLSGLPPLPIYLVLAGLIISVNKKIICPHAGNASTCCGDQAHGELAYLQQLASHYYSSVCSESAGSWQ